MVFSCIPFFFPSHFQQNVGRLTCHWLCSFGIFHNVVGVPRQPPPTSLDEIHNNQMFRQRSEGRENPVLPPKRSMPRKGSKQSLVHAVRRKTSETTDPEVWGSDFQEVVTEDSGRMVAIYSYNGEEPGTLQIQPGQQFRLVG